MNPLKVSDETYNNIRAASAIVGLAYTVIQLWSLSINVYRELKDDVAED